MFIHPAAFFEDRAFRVQPRSCFVIMPFTAPWSNRTYAVIKNIVEASGFTCNRGDDYRGRVILTDIWQQINSAEVILADLTDENPNVYYELGLAHALGKEVIPIVQMGTRIPFDQQVFRILFYEDSPTGSEILQASLPSWIGSLEYSTSPSLLLKAQDVDRFNDWRARQDHVQLSSEDFSRLELSGLDLHQVYMTDGYFTSTVLDDSNLDGAVLIRTDFRSSSLRRSSLQAANLSECNMSYSQLDSANLSDAILIRTRLEQSSLDGAVATRANFSEASLRGTNLDQVDLRDAVLIRANLEGASLRDADVAGATADRLTYSRNRERFNEARNHSALVIVTE